MSEFKRIKGDGDATSDQRVNDEINAIQSGAITKVYPILKPGDWMGIQAGCLRQTIIGTPEEPFVVAGFGYDAPTNFIFINHKDVGDKDPNSILQEAYQNLEEYVSEFEVTEALGEKIVTASGQDFSSEKILCKSHLLEAHQLLNADEILVSIPRRTCMMICSRKANNEFLNQFVTLHQHAWEDDSYGNAPIVNALFVVKAGQIEGMIPLEE